MGALDSFLNMNKLIKLIFKNEIKSRLFLFSFAVFILVIGYNADGNFVKCLCFLISVPPLTFCLLSSENIKIIFKYKDDK